MKTRNGLMSLVALVTLLSVSGCQQDDRPLVGPETPAAERETATAAVTAVTTLEEPLATLVGARSEDGCSVAGAGVQPSDYARDYTCGVGRVAVYAFTAGSGAEAAGLADDQLTASGCVGAPAFPDSAGVDELLSDEPKSHVITTAYDCDGGSVKVILGAARDPDIRYQSDVLPITPGGTLVIDDPAIDLAAIDELALDPRSFVVILTASTTYYTVSVCNGLHLC